MEEKDTLEYESLEADVEEASEIVESIWESVEESTVEPSSEIADSQEDVSVDASSEDESDQYEEEFESEIATEDESSEGIVETVMESERQDPETTESNDDLQYIIQQLDALAEEDAGEVSSMSDVYQIYDSYDAFMESPVYVTRYELELLNRLEFIQYALCVLIALIFLLIFRRK